jgi:hypothetical protein
MMKMPIRMDALSLALRLRASGHDVPDVDDDAGAEAHFGMGLKRGDRYFKGGDTPEIRVYTGSEWIRQATCN